MGLSFAMNHLDDRCIAGSGTDLRFDFVPVVAGLLQSDCIIFIATDKQPRRVWPVDAPDLRVRQNDF
jgi:hypothetical protein